MGISLSQKSERDHSTLALSAVCSVKAKDCSTQISHEFAAFFSFLLTSHIYYWDICKIAAMLALLLAAAIYFMTTFILSDRQCLPLRWLQLIRDIPAIGKRVKFDIRP